MFDDLICTPADHYWIIGHDATQVYSSGRVQMVPISDAVYGEWATHKLASRVASMGELVAVLRTANVAPYITVAPRQARLALAAAGLLDQVETAVRTAGGTTKISWEYATEIYRGDPLIATLQPAISLSDVQIDALFAAAAGL